MCLRRLWCCSGSDVHRVRARKGGGRDLDSKCLAAPDTADVQTGAAAHACALEWASSSFTTRITQCGTLWKTLTQEQKKMATRLNNHDLHVRYVTPMRSFQVVLVNLLLGINPFPLQIWWWFLVPGALWGTRTLGSLGFCWGHRIIAVRKDVPVE